MSRVKRVWRQDEEPVKLWLLVGRDSEITIHFDCPRCGKSWDQRAPTDQYTLTCSCGCKMVLSLKLTLKELEEEVVKGE